MFAVLHATAILIANLFKSRRRLEAENLLLRHQLSIVSFPNFRPTWIWADCTTNTSGSNFR